MALIEAIKSDLSVNWSNKSRFIVITYRIANYFALHRSGFVRALGYPFIKFYHISVIWIIGVEIPEKTRIGKTFHVGHGTGIVLNQDVVIGSNVLIRQCTTIGSKGPAGRSPKIGDNVEIGANTVIIGDVEIGNNVKIGAGSVVTKSLPSDCVAYGNPAKIVSNQTDLLLAKMDGRTL